MLEKCVRDVSKTNAVRHYTTNKGIAIDKYGAERGKMQLFWHNICL